MVTISITVLFGHHTCSQITSWDLNMDIPRPILSILEQQWSDVKLSVTNHDRLETKLPLLATPLLRSLRFNATPGPSGTYDKLDGYSKMPELREIMLNAPNLRKLDITFAPYWMNRNVADPNILQLPLKSTDRLPSLHELIFSGPPDTYEWNSQHCTLLRQCMDCSQLRLLDLGLSCPGPLFEEIGGSLPNLRLLTIGIRTGEARLTIWRQDPPSCRTLGPTIRFINIVRGLHQLDITDFDPAADVLASTIINSQQALQRLSYRVSSVGWRSLPQHLWTASRLQELREQCPNLSHLEIDFPLVEQKWASRSSHKLLHRVISLTTIIVIPTCRSA